jgi:hypothetical protein
MLTSLANILLELQQAEAAKYSRRNTSRMHPPSAPCTRDLRAICWIAPFLLSSTFAS